MIETAEQKYKRLYEDPPFCSSFEEADQLQIERLANPRTMEQKIEWIKTHHGRTARACGVSIQDVLDNPEKYALKLAY